MADDPAATAASNNPELSTLVAAVERRRSRRHAQRRRPVHDLRPGQLGVRRAARRATVDALLAGPRRATSPTSSRSTSSAVRRSSGERPRRGRHRRRAQRRPDDRCQTATPSRSTQAAAPPPSCAPTCRVANGAVHIIDTVLLPACLIADRPRCTCRGAMSGSLRGPLDCLASAPSAHDEPRCDHAGPSRRHCRFRRSPRHQSCRGLRPRPAFRVWQSLDCVDPETDLAKVAAGDQAAFYHAVRRAGAQRVRCRAPGPPPTRGRPKR